MNVARQAGQAVATVVTMTDFEVGTDKAWDDLRKTLRGLARQDFSEPAEIIFLEDEKLKAHIPSDLTEILPQLQIALTNETLQYDMKSEAARHGTADIVILLDGDCDPAPEWLSALVETMKRHPDAGVVSGRTMYEGHTFLERACGVLGRAYVDRRGTTRTEHISNNNAAFRRDVLRKHPLPSEAGPFSSRLHAEAIRRSGWTLLFDSRAVTVHAFEGWWMECDIRRNMGYSFITARQLDPSLPFGRWVRYGYASLLFYAPARFVESCLRIARFYRNYQIRWYELPAVFALAVAVHAMEIPGMISAVKRRPITKTAYR